MKSTRLFIFVASIVAAGQLSAQEVHRYPGTDTVLANRWGWAVAEARRTGAGEFWVGYSVRRLMDEDSYIVSDHVTHGTAGENASLYDLLQIPKPPGLGRTNGYRSKEGADIFKRMKDIALLFRYSSAASGDPSVQEERICDMELLIDLRKIPVFWIGMADDDQSVERLAALFKTVSSNSIKKHLVEAVGIHQRSDKVYPFLSALLKSKEPDDVRANGAFWVSQQRNPAALPLLMDVAQQDPSVNVREQAVFAVSQIDGDASTDALITLVRKADNTTVRARAAFWLGQKASQKAVATLEDVVAGDDESDVQRQALFALSQMKDKEGVDRLIRIAETHPNPRIRKQAIQILGQSDDPKALEALIEIAKK